jgi:chromosome segregation ATPase
VTQHRNKDRIIRIDVQLGKLREQLGQEGTDPIAIQTLIQTLEELRSRIVQEGEAVIDKEPSRPEMDSPRGKLVDLDLRIEKLREEIESGKTCSPTAQVELTILLQDRERLIQAIATIDNSYEVKLDGGYYGKQMNEPTDKSAEKSTENLTKISEDIAALGERLKAQAEKSKKLSSDTDHLLKKTKKMGGSD